MPLLALVVALAPGIVVPAQESPTAPSASEAQTAQVHEPVPEPAAAPVRRPSHDAAPCETRPLGKEPGLDKLRREIFETVCESAAWFYWTTEKGAGTSTRLDFERPLGGRTLARWSGGIVFDDETEGGDWDTGITLYRGFSRDRALFWYFGLDGETGKEVPLETYGTRVVYRQRMLRLWFFGEVIAGVTWPRDTLLENDERPTTSASDSTFSSPARTSAPAGGGLT